MPDSKITYLINRISKCTSPPETCESILWLILKGEKLMKYILLLPLAGILTLVLSADIIVGPADGPASSYPFCGS